MFRNFLPMFQVAEENEKLKYLLRRIKKENEKFKAKIAEKEEKEKVDSWMRQYVTKRE